MTEQLFDVEQGAKSDSTKKPATDDATRDSIILRLYVRPGAGRPAVAGRRGDALYVHVAPPPVDGKANVACIELVAELFGVSRADVELVGGERNRSKRLRVRGVTADRARRVLEAAIEGAEASSRGSRGSAPRR
ncbi:MAG TPA: DUF167 domain-containing protein [Acidimicrobiales bacterium]|nr:DUF167 domain-containing protein [Acidimicrobiales bacterium]